MMSLPMYRRLLFTTAIFIYILTVVSGLVRITGSEIGCAGWPLCASTIVPTDGGGWLELFHRLLVLITGTFIVISAHVAWKQRDKCQDDSWQWVPPILAAGLFIGQAIASTLVLWLNMLWLFVVITVGIQTITLACILVSIVALTAEDYWRKPTYAGNEREAIQARNYRIFVFGTTVASWILLLVGATVAGTSSGLACIGFPACNGELIPTSGGLPIVIHMTHRMTAYVVVLLMVIVFLYTAINRWRDYVLIQWVLLTGALLMTQATLGGANSLLAMPLFLRALHLATAAAYWGSLIIFTILVFRRPALSGLDSSGRILKEKKEPPTEQLSPNP